ncbi:MAG: VWA domain-containing protein [Acidobacteriota bacterium]
MSPVVPSNLDLVSMPHDRHPGRCRGPWRRLLAGVVLAGGLVGPAAGAAESITHLAVRIVTPRDQSFVSGITSIEAELDVPVGLAIERVEFMVDGRLVAALAAPPWHVTEDLGADYDVHLIQVTAVPRAGDPVSASVSTRALRVNEESSIELVNVFATVQDRHDHYVMNLDRDSFLVLEDGQPQDVTYFSADRLPLSVAIVMDTSLSMEGANLDEARQAAIQFLDTLAPGDQVGVVSFNDQVLLVHPLDEDLKSVKKAIAALTARGGTALYDAVARTSRLLAGVDDTQRRRAIVLLSDGRDEASSGLTPGSLLTFEESLAEAVHANVLLYAIGLGRDLDQRLDFFGRLSLQEVLDRMARETGGRAFMTRKADRLRKVYTEIENELRHHYSMAYTPRIRRHDGSWHAIEVRVREPSLRVHSRRGYYAATDSPG